MPGSKLLVLGDSVHSGQGLLPAHKLSSIVAAQMNLTPEMVAHSGATIGVSTTSDDRPVHIEVPVAEPTIVAQVDTDAVQPSDVSVVLVNGGINDIDFRIILSPLTSTGELRGAIKRHCFDDMVILLRRITTRFPARDVPVVLTGYYPVLSNESRPFRIPFLMQSFGIGVPFFVDSRAVFRKTIEMCTLFWRESTLRLQQAVAHVNAELGVPKVRWANPEFTSRNAVFAPDPWLFGVNGDFSPQDELVDVRRQACNIHIEEWDVFGRESCYRASAGHPNRLGAQKYAEAILAVL